MNPNEPQVFISFKNLDTNGKPTRDSQLAKEVYKFLAGQGLRVFFSNVSLEKLGIAAYTKAIDDALDVAKVLVAVGTSREHLDSQWVRYEWNSFFNDILSGVKPNGRLFVYIAEVSLNELPRALRQNQVFVDEAGSHDTLYNFICNALGVVAQQRQTVPEGGKVVYACYAAADRQEVMKRLTAIEALGTRVLTEVDLRAGESWEKKIRRWIDQSDAMLLFWSEAASRSSSVENEWRYALEKRGISFIRPVYLGIPPMPPPPIELANLHFAVNWY